MELASFAGTRLADKEVKRRIEAIVRLWDESIPPGWERKPDSKFLDHNKRYRRGGDKHVPRGEHVIECEVLCPSPVDETTMSLGATLVDGVNALPLTTDTGGRRKGNIEADMLLLVRGGDTYSHQLIEVKTTSNNAWYASVQNLRQLKLFSESRDAQRLFHKRWPDLELPPVLPATGVVLAPHVFYEARGQKVESVAGAQRLFERMRAEAAVDVLLATWQKDGRIIAPL